MDNQTNRLAQIIGEAADKYRRVRGLDPTQQDYLAAEAIEAEYLLIRRDELPAVEIVDRTGVDHVDVKSDAGTWSCKTASADYARKTGLEYLAASIALQEWRENAAQRALDKRRDELACEHFEGVYEHLPREGYRKAIDRIIELEGNAA